MPFYEAKRRVEDPDASPLVPVSWTSDHGSGDHYFIYDAPANEDGHAFGTAVIVSWVWVSLANPGDAWPLVDPKDPSKGRHNVPRHVSIWDGSGRWLDGEAAGVDGFVDGNYRGWPIPHGGKVAVVSLADVPLSVVIERNVLPK